MRNPKNLSLALAALTALAAPLAAQAIAVVPPTDLAGWTTVGVSGATPANGSITELAGAYANGSLGYVSTAGSTAIGAALTPSLQFNEQNGSRIRSAAFSANAGDTFAAAFNYITTDGSGFPDYAWARIVRADISAATITNTVGWLVTVRSGNSDSGTMIPGGVTDEYRPRDTITNFDTFNFNARTANNPPLFSGLGDATGQCFNLVSDCGFTGWLRTTHTFAAAGSYRLEVGVMNAVDNQFDSAMVFDFAGLTGTPPLAASPIPEPATQSMMLLGALASIAVALRRRRHTER
ncbi:putative PEP-CTERM exosortase interaction domain-containing protein [Rubrivivax sp. A210]|uniref:NF038132 family protein n=1 Tax=Rubrivivax sp. A210 TaxID=2772301 RepID=UPI0019194561|nr:NF038132 family protein [Rubrivivax sp. A210]CAD5374000.1 putative PEP-CTERM exosortase interaction domain-containing protein [Rubrivivax sp. A210]